jgi:HAD superfamily hydrolase (TIGR01509 family)
MTMKFPRAVLFDMDNTLIESERFFAIALNEFAERLYPGVAVPTTESMIGVSDEAIVASLVARSAGVASPGAVRDGCRWITARVGELFRGGLSMRPGANRLLTTLRESNVPMGLVTNTARDLVDLALETIGREFFDIIVCGDEVSHQKPNPEPYERAVRLLGLHPKDCIAVEDSPTGVESAARCGCHVLLVPSTAVPGDWGQVERRSLDDVDLGFLVSLAPHI